jgi:viroplasmin and RNaseH domain-containing protein
MAKYNIYAVGYGIDPDTKEPVMGIKCTNWPDCQKYTKGIEGAKFKGFQTDAEADIWIEKIRAEIVSSTIDDIVEETENVSCNKEFIQVCKELNVIPSQMTAYLQKQFVEQYKFLQMPFN